MRLKKLLIITLRIKIIVTLFLWALPLLLVTEGLAQTLGLEVSTPLFFTRLLGAAYLALVVAYYSGLKQVLNGDSASWVVVMGLVSNGIATIILMVHCIEPAFSSYPLNMKIFLIASASATALITLGLALSGKSMQNTAGN